MSADPILEDLESGAKTIAIIVAGSWAYWKFVLQREAYPKIEFQLDARPLGRQGGRLVLELLATMKNVGAVRHRAPQFSLNLRYVTSSDPIASGDSKINFQTRFPHSTNKELGLEKRAFVPWRPFVEPGVTQIFTYVADVPDGTTFVLVQSEFCYDDEWRTTHSAQKVVFVGEEKKG
jgi:hypothetical protein